MEILTGGILTIRIEGRVSHMNMLIINGSPRKRGNISRMLDAMEEEAKGRGFDTTCISVSDLKVATCTGCMICRTRLQCTLPEDDAQRVLRLIEACDVLVVGAPCYWGNIPGQLKVLFDRIVYGMMGESSNGIPKPLHKGKKAILVSTCTTPFPFNILFNQSRGAVRALKEILKWSGFKVAATVQQGGTKAHPVMERTLRSCRRAVRRL